MTTQADRSLLERISNFDKRQRQMAVGANVTVITYSTALGWFIEEELQTGSSFTVSEDLIPVVASPSDLAPILDRIPAPAPPEHLTALPRIRELVEQASARLETASTPGFRDEALWRLVDAAGLLAELASPNATGQPGSPTGGGHALAPKIGSRN